MQPADLIGYERRFLIGDTHQQRRFLRHWSLFQAVLQNRSTWRIRNLKAIDQVVRAVMKRMEGKQMQVSVRNDDEVRRLDLSDKGRKQVFIQLTQMTIRRREYLIRVFGDVLGVQHELFELKSETLLNVQNTAHGTQMPHCPRFAGRDDENQDL